MRGWMIGCISLLGCAVDEPRVCKQYRDDDATPTPVDIRIRNGLDVAVMLAHGCGQLAVRLQSEQGWSSEFDGCNASCEQQFDGDTCYGCTVCLGSSYLRIEPGATATVPWWGALYERAMPEPECFASSPCGESCLAQRVPTAGMLELELEAITEADCTARVDPATCTCDADASGGCNTVVSVEIAPTIERRHSFEIASAAASGEVSFVIE